MTSIKRVKTEEEVHFERRDNEISKSPNDVSLSFCSILKDLFTFKCYFIACVIACALVGIIPPYQVFSLEK